MPPKKNNKEQVKKNEKIIEDKTFGLKNKKGNKQQKFIAQVNANQRANQKNRNDSQEEAKKRKEAAAAEKRAMAQLFKPVVEKKKVNTAADGKSICQFYMKGLCTKGPSCKFSHDLSTLNEAERKEVEAPTTDSNGIPMASQAENATSIICRNFLAACEKNLYGPLWQCPNGRSCIYQHKLPFGYELNRHKKKKGEEDHSGLTIEELVEIERSKLGDIRTPVNEKSFKEWSIRKRKEKEQEEKKQKAKNKGRGTTGNTQTGRELFTIKPELFTDDSNVTDDIVYKKEEPSETATASSSAQVDIDDSVFDDEDLEGLDDL